MLLLLPPKGVYSAHPTARWHCECLRRAVCNYKYETLYSAAAFIVASNFSPATLSPTQQLSNMWCRHTGQCSHSLLWGMQSPPLTTVQQVRSCLNPAPPHLQVEEKGEICDTEHTELVRWCNLNLVWLLQHNSLGHFPGGGWPWHHRIHCGSQWIHQLPCQTHWIPYSLPKSRTGPQMMPSTLPSTIWKRGIHMWECCLWTTVQHLIPLCPLFWSSRSGTLNSAALPAPDGQVTEGDAPSLLPFGPSTLASPRGECSTLSCTHCTLMTMYSLLMTPQ